MFDIIVRSEKGMIEWNYEALKAELIQRLQRYRGLVFTEEMIKEAKEIRALLNKVSKAIDDERKKNKKIYMEPFEVFENQAKELTGLVANVSSEIDVQVKSFEQQAKETKRAAIKEFFKELRFYLVPLEKLFDEKWLNASVSDKQWKEQLSGKIESINADLAFIDNLPEEDREPVKLNYLDCLNLNKASELHKQKKEREKALKAYENERKQQAVETPTVVPEVAPEPQIEPTTLDNVGEQVFQRNMWADAEKQKLIATLQKMVEIGLFFTFENIGVAGTKEQLTQISEFMKENGIRFGKVE